MTESLEFVAFDIETTGFAVTDSVTVVGFAVPMGVRVFCCTDERSAPDVESTVAARTEQHVQVSTHASERALLEAVGAFTAERLYDDDVLLVAYNGERWKSGFDLPFLRTRLSMADVDWPFCQMPYADLMPVLTNRFNTTIDGESRSDLEGVYETLCDGGYGELDPFAESAEAVTAFEDGRFADLVMHNVADVLRTRELGLLAQRYCSKSDFKLKSLTPTIHD
jgi:uncharacterized protein YprB with RNaseH-like and TPR domain